MSGADDKVPMTVEGKRLLDEELKHLMTVERPAVVKAIEIARGHGDLSENADYSAAKERQGFIEGRIQDINGKLARAQVIDPSSHQVRKSRLRRDRRWSKSRRPARRSPIKIVGVDEADIKNRQDRHHLSDRPRADRKEPKAMRSSLTPQKDKSVTTSSTSTTK